MPGVYEQVRYILITFLCETLQMSNISTEQGYLTNVFGSP